MNEEQDPHGGPPEAVADPTPDPGTTIDWDSADNPWKTRFEGYRPGADQKITRLSQMEQAREDFREGMSSGNTEQARRAAAVLGLDDFLEIEDPDPPTYDDPADELRAELAALRAEQEAFKGQLTAREQKEKEAAEVAAVNSQLDKLGVKDEQERNVVLGVAFTLPMDEQGLPDVAAAAKFIEDRDKARWETYRGSKPRTSIGPGQTATQQKNIADMTTADGQLTQEGLNYLAQRYEDAR